MLYSTSEITMSAACALMGAAAGLLVRALVLRLSGIRVPRRPPTGAAARGGLEALVARVLPMSASSESSTRRSLEAAGLDASPSTVWAARVLLAAMGVLLGGVLAGAVGGAWSWLLSPLCGALGFLAPQLWLSGRGRAWRDELERELPSALDLMAVSVAAGVSFEGAVRIVSERTDGALARALAGVVDEAGYTSMTEALEGLASRARVQPLTVFVASLTQAQRSGVPVSEILRSQATSVRAYRRRRLEEEAERLPVRMVFPQLLILAAVVVAVLVPALASIVASLG